MRVSEVQRSAVVCGGMVEAVVCVRTGVLWRSGREGGGCCVPGGLWGCLRAKVGASVW